MDDFIKEDEIITVKMTRRDYNTMRRVIEREQAYEFFATFIKRHWIWIVGSGVLTAFYLYKELFQKVA